MYSNSQSEKIKELKRTILYYRLTTIISFIVSVLFIVGLFIYGSVIFGFLGGCLLLVGIVCIGVRKGKEDELDLAMNDWTEYERLLNERNKQARLAEERHEAMVQKEIDEKKEEERRRKMVEHPVCPMCGSKNTNRISTLNRAVSIGALGLASSKIGKQYECKNCKHKW